MKKKIYSFGVAIAALAAFVGCSSENDLTQVGQDDVVKATSPFTFNVTMDDGNSSTASSAPKMDLDFTEVTRATTVSSNPFTEEGAGFTLYGFQDGEDEDHGMFFKEGVAFTSDGDGTWFSTANWPTNPKNEVEGELVDDPLDKCYFYAVSYYGKSASTIESGGPTLTDPTGTSNDAVSFTYTLPTDGNKAFLLDKQEDLLVASDLTGKKSGDVDLTFSHALANLELKVIVPADGYSSDDGGKYDEAVATRTSLNSFVYIKSITVRNLPASGIYTFGAETPWAAGDNRKDAVITWEKGIIIPAVSFGQALGVTSDVDATYPNAADRKAAEHALYTDIAVGDASIMLIPHKGTAASSNFSSDNNNIFIEINGFVGNVDGRTDQETPLNAEQIAILEGAIAASQTGTTWDTEFQETWDAYTYGHHDTTGGNDDQLFIGVGADMLPDVNTPGFYCGMDDGSGTADPGTNAYIKFNADKTFAPNKKYTLYIDLSNMLKDDGDYLIDAI